VLDRTLRVPAREGMLREEAILEEPRRRHVEVIGCQKFQNHHSTRSLSSLGLCSHEPHGWRCGAAQCVFRHLTNSSAGLEVLAPRPWRFKVIYLASPRDLHPASVIHHRSIYLPRMASRVHHFVPREPGRCGLRADTSMNKYSRSSRTLHPTRRRGRPDTASCFVVLSGTRVRHPPVYCNALRLWLPRLLALCFDINSAFLVLPRVSRPLSLSSCQDSEILLSLSLIFIHLLCLADQGLRTITVVHFLSSLRRL
jgi:hypothetical protein